MNDATSAPSEETTLPADDADRPSDEAGAEEGSKDAAAEDEPEPEPGRMQKLLLEYGAIGIIVLLSLSALTWLGFAAAFMVGFQVEGAAETAGVAAAASAGWLLTKPIRIPVAVVLTPVVAALWHRVRGTKKPPKDEE